MNIDNPFTVEFLQYFDEFCMLDSNPFKINYNRSAIDRKGLIYLEKGYKKQLYPYHEIFTTPMILNKIDRNKIISNLKPLYGEFVIYNSGYVNYEFIDSKNNIVICVLKNDILLLPRQTRWERFTMEKYIEKFVNV